MSSNEKQILFDYSVESCTPFVPIQNHLITRNSFCAVPFKLVFMFHHTEKVWIELYHYIVWQAKNEGNVSLMYFLAFNNFICHLDLFQLLFISKVKEIWLVVDFFMTKKTVELSSFLSVYFSLSLYKIFIHQK